MEGDVMTWLMQFGSAGLIAMMWLIERRQGMVRERQLTEAHERVLQQRVELGQLMAVVTENTRAVASLEGAQRQLIGLVERIGVRTGEAA